MRNWLVMCLVVWLGLFAIQAIQASATRGAAKSVRTMEAPSTVEEKAEISLNRNWLNFRARTTEGKTGSQTLIIGCPAIGDHHWAIDDDADWFDYSPASGTDTGAVSVWVNPAGLTPGTYKGKITVSSPPATPQTVTVKLVVYNTATGPMGQMSKRFVNVKTVPKSCK